MPSRIVCAAIVISFFAHSASGQAGRAEINGTVTDQGGGVLPGVGVTATDEATGLARTTTTSETGRFVISSVVPGRYTLKVELAGFQTQTRTGVVISVGQEITVNLTLAIGGLEQEVTVTGAVPIVEVTSSRIGTNMSNQDIDSLPSAGRQQLSLLQLGIRYTF